MDHPWLRIKDLRDSDTKTSSGKFKNYALYGP